MKKGREILKTYEKRCPYDSCKSDNGEDVSAAGPGSGWTGEGAKMPTSRDRHYVCRACEKHFIYLGERRK